jgi:hypothetical protein
MMTVNFQVPDDVIAACDQTSEHSSRSTVADPEMNKRRIELFAQLTERRQRRPSATEADVQATRNDSRM